MSLPELPGPPREAAIVEAVREGRHDPIEWVPIRSDARGRVGVLYVMADALKLEGMRLNVTATTSQHVADLLGASMPTARIVDLAHTQATLRARPAIQKPHKTMAYTGATKVHSDAIDRQLAGKTGFVRTVGKDWILHDRLIGRPDLACNYGWIDHQAPYTSWAGERVWQPVGTAHNRHHVDYSQTCTLVRRTMLVDGEERDLLDVMRDSELSFLVSYEGTMRVTRMFAVPDPNPVAPRPVPAPSTEVKFIRARNYTAGRSGPVQLVVIHSMEAVEKPNTAEAVAAWFAGPQAPRASAHYCIDSDSTVQCVLESDVAWHAPGANHNGIGIEHAGYARQTAAEWSDDYSAKMLDRSAALAADICKRYGLPVKFVDYLGLRAGERGITTHREVSKAFKRSTHTDPGLFFPMDSYIARVAACAS